MRKARKVIAINLELSHLLSGLIGCTVEHFGVFIGQGASTASPPVAPAENMACSCIYGRSIYRGGPLEPVLSRVTDSCLVVGSAIPRIPPVSQQLTRLLCTPF